MDAAHTSLPRFSLPKARGARLAACAIAAGFAFALGSAGAATPWIWLDGNGQRVFSDRPPPASVPDKSILKRPGQVNATPVPTAGAESHSGGPAAAGKPTAPAPAPAATVAPPKDDALEKKKKEAEAAELAKRAAEEKKQKEAMAENCQRAQQAKTNLETAPRLGMTNAQGQTVRMDEATRQAELARVNRIIESSCR